jgi:hypothetical protein
VIATAGLQIGCQPGQHAGQARDSPVRISREGPSWFHRVNLSQPLGRLFLRGAVGFTWAHAITTEGQGAAAGRGRRFENLFSPDAAATLDWRAAAWLSLHLTASYRSTFVYLDNIPRKGELAYDARLAPFYGSRCGFLRTFRVEAAAFTMYFPDAWDDADAEEPPRGRVLH